MTGITFISRDYGVNVSIVRLSTTDTTATALAANYITAQAANIALANEAVGSGTNSPFQWFTNDCILLSASDGLSFCSINSTFTSLSLIASEVIPLAVSVTNAITAHAGGGQTNAVQLASQLNRVTTVATAGDSVKLPVAAPGLSITVVNNGANAMQVYGNGSDTINGIAAATGVSQLPNSVVRYVSAVAGLWQSQDVNFGYNANFLTISTANSLTAHAGGGQASALALTAAYNVVTTVATAADSVKLPPSAPGMEIIVTNSGANAMQVYGTGTDTINGVAAATGVSQAAGATNSYRCAAAGNWIANLVVGSSNIMQNNVVNTMNAGSSIIMAKVNGTESANAVTASGVAGVITTSSLTTAGGSNYAITWTNTAISSTSTVHLSIQGGTNTTENITLKVAPGSGTATLTIYNNTAATALNGTILIGYLVF